MALGENTIGLAMPDALGDFIYNLMPGDREDEPEEKNVQPMAEVAFDLVCPVCFELPAGEVHQCYEGHCYCIDCWRRLDPRRCPECRDLIPLRNRSRAQEARIAALPAVCDHCDQTTTRGAMAEHLRSCQQRPITCSAAAAGCGLEGMAAGQATAKQPLSGRVRALDEEEKEEEGGRRRRQRVGPAPPSVANMKVMGMAEATAALREHVMVVWVAEVACIRLSTLAKGEGEFSEPLQRQGVVAVVQAMQMHPQVATVQTMGCDALNDLTKTVSIAGRQAAAEAGAIEAAMNAMQAHLQNNMIQFKGLHALTSLCYGYDAAMSRAIEGGALRVAVAAMRAHPQDECMQLAGSSVLWRFGKGESNEHQITEAGGRAVVLAAMQAFPACAKMKYLGKHLLDVLPLRTANTA
jgi:hypothetical protein